VAETVAGARRRPELGGVINCSICSFDLGLLQVLHWRFLFIFSLVITTKLLKLRRPETTSALDSSFQRSVDAFRLSVALSKLDAFPNLSELEGKRVQLPKDFTDHIWSPTASLTLVPWRWQSEIFSLSSSIHEMFPLIRQGPISVQGILLSILMKPEIGFLSWFSTNDSATTFPDQLTSFVEDQPRTAYVWVLTHTHARTHN
jgi:hypothetical protein